MPTKSRFSDPIRADLLQRQCNQILQDIYYAQDTASLDRVDSLKKEYNHLSHQLESLCCEVLPDPLSHLPPEVWMDIIQEATYWNAPGDAIEYPMIMSSTDALLALTLVCKKWAKALLDAPVLWTNIEIGRGEADAQAKLQAVLSLSRDLPITLVLYVPMRQWDADLPALLHHIPRIKNLVPLRPMRDLDPSSVEPEESLRHFFRDTGSLPGLQSIRDLLPRRLFTYVDADVILKNCAALTRAKTLLLTIDHILNRTGAPIRAFTVLAAPADIVQHAGAFEYAEDIEFWHPTDGTHANASHSDTSPLSLPALRSIRDRQPDGNFLPLLRLTPNLTELVFVIRDRWQYLHDFLNQLDQLPCLSSLTVCIENISGRVSFSTASSVATCVRYLRVHGFAIGDSVNSEGVIEAHEALFSVFPAYFSHVEALDLVAIPFGPNVSEYIRSIPCLQSLGLWNSAVLPDASISSASLETVELSALSEHDLQATMTIIECPALSKLTMSHLELVNGPALHWHGPNKPMVYDTIVDLTIGSSLCGQWAIPDFTSLRRLQLCHIESLSDQINELFLSLIVDPTNCPVLEEIEPGCIPEWDLFFIMLERRNYLPSAQGVARIKTIVFEYLIPDMLLAPLVDILGGRFASRPTNFDLSFSGFMDMYFDISLPGCSKCLRLLASCLTAPVMTEVATTEEPFLFPLEVPCEQHAVPADVWRWLNGREERLTEWKARRSASSIERREGCWEMGAVRQPFRVTA